MRKGRVSIDNFLSCGFTDRVTALLQPLSLQNCDTLELVPVKNNLK